MKERKHDDNIILRQKHFNMCFFAVWMIIVTTIQWIGVDMYLPALPVLKEEFSTTAEMLNFSLNSGIIMCAVGMLVGGPLSDRYGRRPVFLSGLFISAATLVCCAFSHGIWSLVLFRGICGFGSGIAQTVTTAMVRDSFSGSLFRNTTTMIQSLAAVAPIFAPTIGSLIINYLSWRFIFINLAVATIITIIPMLWMTETWPKEKRVAANMKAVLKQSWGLLKERSFVLFLILMGLLTLPTWAYIAVSPYVCIDFFGLSNVTYGLYYGIGAVASCLAPFLYILLRRFMRRGVEVAFIIAVTLIAAILYLTVASVTVVIFMAASVLVLFAEGMIRPLGIVALLENHKKEAGSASAFIQFTINVVGAIGTAIGTLGWSSFIHGMGLITIVCALIPLAILIYMRMKNYMRAELWERRS